MTRMSRDEALHNLDSIIRGHVNGANRYIALDSLALLSTPEQKAPDEERGE